MNFDECETGNEKTVPQCMEQRFHVGRAVFPVVSFDEGAGVEEVASRLSLVTLLSNQI